MPKLAVSRSRSIRSKTLAARFLWKAQISPERSRHFVHQVWSDAPKWLGVAGLDRGRFARTDDGLRGQSRLQKLTEAQVRQVRKIGEE